MSEGNKVLENNTDIIHKISKEEYKDEWFIDKAILCYKAQNEKVFTFFRDNSQKDWLKKYNWCQRPDNTTMSLKRFDHIGNVHGHMSESLAEHYGLEQIDLNTFMHEFVAKLVEELNNLKTIEKSHKEENGKLRVEYEKVYEDNLTLAHELEQEKEKNKELEEKLKIAKQLYNDACVCIATDCVEKDKIKDMMKYREFELQQEYKEFEEDVEWRTYKKILEGK